MKQKEKAAEKLIKEFNIMKKSLASLKEDMELSLSIKSGGELDGFVCQLKNVSFGYPNAKLLFENVISSPLFDTKSFSRDFFNVLVEISNK